MGGERAAVPRGTRDRDRDPNRDRDRARAQARPRAPARPLAQARPPAARARSRAGWGIGPLAASGGLLLATACGAPAAAPGGLPGTGDPAGVDAPAGGARAGAADRDPPTGTVTVFAAASLAAVSERWEAALEAAHPGLDVVVVLDGSPGLARQLLDGAPADVFLSADERTMAVVTGAGLAREPRALARNEVVVAVPAANPGGLGSALDVGRAGLGVALCDDPVPCGAAARRALAVLGLEVEPVTEEASVSAVLTRVRLGEVDAGVVYATDATAAGGEVRAFALPAPAASAGSTTYQVATLAGAANPRGAAAVVDHVLGGEGRAALAEAGFEVLAEAGVEVW